MTTMTVSATSPVPPEPPLERKSLSKIPDTITYYPHQIRGIRDLAKRGSFLLADEMGLGKTLQALTVAAIDFERGWANRVIAVTPASLKWNWKAEIQEFTKFSCYVLDGTPRQRTAQLEEFVDQKIDILIVNYEQVVAHLDHLNKIGFDIAIFDEAHYLKGHKTKRTKACHQLRSTRNFLLTGSPLLNQVNELWSLLYMIAPTEFPNYWKFVNRYAVFGGYKDKQIIGVKNSLELQERVAGVMLRRLKKDVLDLPDKQYVPVRIDLHPEQRKLYDQAVEEMKIDLPDNPNPMEIENALSRFLRLKQICGTTAAISGYEDHSTKLDVCVERAVEITENDERVVIFTQFRKIQECIMRRLQEDHGILCWELNGDTPKKERVAVVKDWANHPKSGAIVCMLQVAGVGLNMTAASKCIFVDKLFVPKLNEQAEDRLHRIGASKTQPIQIIHLIARNTIESRIESILKRKRKLFDTLVEDNTWRKALYTAIVAEDDDE